MIKANKAETNIATHGVDFADAVAVFERCDAQSRSF